MFAKVPGPCSHRPPFIVSPSNLPTSSVGDVASFTKTFIRRPDTTSLMWFHFLTFASVRFCPAAGCTIRMGQETTHIRMPSHRCIP